MAEKYLQMAFTPAVAVAQRRYYGRSWELPGNAPDDPLGEDERAFVAARDSFYMATVSEAGWPYLQHRGGPLGFLRVLAPSCLAFADYGGNRQMLSTGNLSANPRVSLFLMDYARRTRLKILGHARVEDAREHPDLANTLAEPSLRRVVERIYFIAVVSFDWNCPKYITPRYTSAEVQDAIAPLRARIAELESELKRSPSP
jgi:predicted pyridoxine 5'-phosphate oxidase superfamily flavin-nucleotide-binding protein